MAQTSQRLLYKDEGLNLISNTKKSWVCKSVPQELGGG